MDQIQNYSVFENFTNNEYQIIRFFKNEPIPNIEKHYSVSTIRIPKNFICEFYDYMR